VSDVQLLSQVMYISWFMMAGPRFLFVSRMINSCDCLSSLKVVFYGRVRQIVALRLFNLVASVMFFSNIMILSSISEEARGGYHFFNLM